jgi:D-serine deaminase-like pyridoxal phosphate-dependent protein
MNPNWYNDVTTPALVLNYEQLVKNVQTMANFAKENNIKLRPHIKTHKCPEIGKMQLEAGASGICVATVGEAEVFVENGFDDILIANEVVELHKVKRLAKLNKKALARVCVDSEKNIKDLNRAAMEENIKLEILFEIDVGLTRNGVKPDGPVLELANLIKESPALELVGLQGYEGHLKYLKDVEYRKQRTEECMQLLVNTRDLLNDNGFDIEYTTASNSTTYMFAGKYPGIIEIQPGTYALSDHELSEAVPHFQPAISVLATINNQTGKRNFTIDAGEKSCPSVDGKPILKYHPKSRINILTEEHSQFRAGAKNSFEIGQKIELVPSHACLTANLWDHFVVVKENKVIGKWEIKARGKNY